MSTRIDYLAYPPAHFPLRDLLVLEQIALGPTDVVCEIGVGSGATAARLARLCQSVTGLDVSRSTIESLRYLEGRHSNLKLDIADVCRPDDLYPYWGSFSRVVSCDTLEHVADPPAYFRAIASLLRPGGEFLVTFPNEPVERMHGITRFDDPPSLRATAEAAGLTDVRIEGAVLSPRAQCVANALGWRPIGWVRGLLRRSRGPAEAYAGQSAPPQVFEHTFFGSNMDRLRRISPLLNFYWFGVLRIMSATGSCFVLDPAFSSRPFTESQVLVRGGRAS